MRQVAVLASQWCSTPCRPPVSRLLLAAINAAEGMVTPASLTFTTSDWNTPHAVTVVGQNDALVDGNVPYHVVTAAAVSSDGNYNGMAVADVAVTNLDNDVLPNIAVMATTPSVHEASNSSAVFTITRTGSTVSDLLVRYAITGTATTGADYVSLGASVVIPAGSSSALVPGMAAQRCSL